MLQENHTFDNYFGMLNPYRETNDYNVGRRRRDLHRGWHRRQADKISAQDDAGDTFKLFKLTSTCVDDESSDWLASYGDVNRYDFLTTRKIQAERLRPHGGRLCHQLRSARCILLRHFHRSERPARDGLLRRGIPQLLLLHGFAVRAVESLVLAGIEQEHRQPDRDLYRRHDPGPGARSRRTMITCRSSPSRPSSISSTRPTYRGRSTTPSPWALPGRR